MYDFILDPLTCQAEEYFADHMKKIFLLNRQSGEMCNFYRHRVNPVDGFCFFLSVLALLGLEKDDRRLCGTVDTIPKDGYRSASSYKHSWVEFRVGNDKFVYDPLTDFVLPLGEFYSLCNPRNITSKRTLVEVIKPYLNNKYAHKITDTIWQFKPKTRVPEDGDEIKNGHIFNALSKGHLIGNFGGEECSVITFVADEPRYHY